MQENISCRFIRAFSTIVVLVFLYSCSPTLYTVAPPITPLPKARGEGDLGLGGSILSGTENSGIGLSLQGSYAFSDRFFASLNYLVSNHDVAVDTMPIIQPSIFPVSPSWGNCINIFEIGLGRYWIDPMDERLRTEIAAGYGMGFIENRRSDLATVSSRYSNFFVQPAIGLKSKILSVAASLKMNTIQIQQLSWEYPDRGAIEAQLTSFKENKLRFVLEPGVSVGVHFPPVDVSAKYIWSSLESNTLPQDRLPMVSNHNFSLSISWNFKRTAE